MQEKTQEKTQKKMRQQSDARHQRLQQCISDRGWNKAEFSRQMGIVAQDVNKYLDGRLNIENLYLQLQNSGCDVHWIRTGEQSSEADRVALLAMLQRSNITKPEQLQQFLQSAQTIREISMALAGEVEVLGRLSDMGGVRRVNVAAEEERLLSTVSTKARE
jgi:hypothetical protein